MNRMLSSLGAFDTEKAMDVLEYHFGNMSTITKGMIAYEALQSKYDTIGKEMAVALIDICDYALSGLSTDDIKKAVIGHLATLNGTTRTNIISEAISGNFTTLTNEFAKVSTSICQKARDLQTQNPNDVNNPNSKSGESESPKTSDNSWMIYAGLAVVGAGAIYYFTKSGKKGKRRSRK